MAGRLQSEVLLVPSGISDVEGEVDGYSTADSEASGDEDGSGVVDAEAALL